MALLSTVRRLESDSHVLHRPALKLYCSRLAVRVCKPVHSLCKLLTTQSLFGFYATQIYAMIDIRWYFLPASFAFFNHRVTS
jgi:hypothetical protein